MSALKHWKSQEVASYSPANQCSFLFFLFMQQAMFIDRYDYHSHPSTLNCIFHSLCSESCTKKMLQHKAECWRFAYAQISSSNNLPRLSCLVRHQFIIRTKIRPAATLKRLHTKNMTWWPQICQFMCPLHKSYCTQHLTFILTQYFGVWGGVFFSKIKWSFRRTSS